MSAQSIDAMIGQLTVTATRAKAPPGESTTMALNIFTIDNFPSELAESDFPCLYPDPVGWLGGSESTPGVFDNASAAYIADDMALHYMFAFAPAGSAELTDLLPDEALLIGALKLSLIRMDHPMTKITSVMTGRFGPLQDPTQHTFLGCALTVNAKEYHVEGGI